MQGRIVNIRIEDMLTFVQLIAVWNHNGNYWRDESTFRT